MTKSAHVDRLWEDLARTGAAVRTPEPVPPASVARHAWRRLAVRAAYFAAVAVFVSLAAHAASSPLPVHADGSADADLFSLTNQDRASNGVRSLGVNGTLGSIGEGARYSGCPGLTIYGRSYDMISRNYFAHPILNCGQYVFSIMSAFGVHYQSAGENIGWNTVGGAASAASSINSAFMNSPDHRANILNGAYNEAGIGSDNSGGAAWTGGGGAYTGTWMFSEEFAQMGSSAPPPPPPPPVRPTRTPVRNTPAPTLPAAAPATTAAPTPVATATPVPTATPTPVPTAIPGLIVAPGLEQAGGLLYDSVESVLESYLIG